MRRRGIKNSPIFLNSSLSNDLKVVRQIKNQQYFQILLTASIYFSMKLLSYQQPPKYRGVHGLSQPKKPGQTTQKNPKKMGWAE